MLRAIAACGMLGSMLLATFALVRPVGLVALAAAAGMPPAMPPPAPAPIDSFVAERDSLMKEVLQHIAGRENAPAESVFKNI